MKQSELMQTIGAQCKLFPRPGKKLAQICGDTSRASPKLTGYRGLENSLLAGPC